MVDRSFAQLVNRTDVFAKRHIGPDNVSVQNMLETIGYPSLQALVEATVPDDIYRTSDQPLSLPKAESEADMLAQAAELAQANPIYRSYLGMGYTPCVLPGVIRRTVLENPGWYTQ